LSDKRVNASLKDSKGFMWFATFEGLNRYDGYNIVEYKYDQTDSTSISSNYAMSPLFEDSEGYIWIGTMNKGLNRFDRNRETFIRYMHDPDNSKSISNNRPYVIYEDKSDILWIGMWGGGGLNNFDRQTETFKQYKPVSEIVNHKANGILSILEDSSGKFWVGTWEGLFIFDRQKEVFSAFKPPESTPEYFNHLQIECIVEDSDEVFWISTNDGLFKYDQKNYQITHYNYNPNDPYSLTSKKLLSMVEDKNENNKYLWISSYNGLNKFDKTTGKVERYVHDYENPNSIARDILFHIFQDTTQNLLWIGGRQGGVNKLRIHDPGIDHYIPNPDKSPFHRENYIFSYYKDKNNTLWVGTVEGLFQYDPGMNMIARYKLINNNPIGIIYKIIEDKSGILWLGTSDEGLIKFNRKTKKFYSYKHDPNNENSLGDNYVWEIFEDSFGMLWIGNRNETGGRGLNLFDRGKNEIRRFYSEPDNPNSLANNWITAIHEDKLGSIWIATQYGGISRLKPEDREKMKFTNYSHIAADTTSLSSNSVFAIFEESEEMGGNLWFGTNKGLNRFNRQDQSFTSYTRKSGLLSDYIYGFVRDKSGNFWLNTRNGIVRFDPDEEPGQEYKLFEYGDEIPLTTLNERGCYIDQKGKIYFGGRGGFISFYPDSIKHNTHIPPIVITDFKVHNNKFKLDSCISVKKTVYLSYKENYFSFEFAALDYINPGKNKYAYYLEGIENDWIYCENRRFANYVFVTPGEYIFHVKGSNNDGIWNANGTSIKIIISPPWWDTKLAYVFYMFLVGLFIYRVWRFQTNRLKIKHQLEMEHFEAVKLREVDQMKSRFFANISHEFRTPLTLIEGPVRQLIQGNFQGNVKDAYNLIVKNTRRLLDLINQLLDLSKLETRKLKLQAAKQNILPLLSGLVQSFESLARQKDIDFIFNKPEIEIDLYIEQAKFEKIIINLLSNAFKFTPESGIIVVDVSRGEAFSGKNLNSPSSIDQNASPQQSQFPIPNSKFVQITITNSGSYLTQEQIEHIFDRFYQVNESSREHLEGTGIGLALVKELIELHHGQINVRSDPDSGTSFILTLPFGKDHLIPEEIVEIYDTTLTHLHGSDQSPKAIEKKSKSLILKSTGRQRILIVEDNQDVRSYVAGLLNTDYDILETGNGEQALEIARKKNLHLILTDVMMPGIDGMEFCRLLKEDLEISHIPVIMLTARADLDDRLDGLELGADDYIAKPFEARELRLRIRNVLSQRERLRERFSQEFSIEPLEMAKTTADEQFMGKLLSSIEHELHRPEFNVDEIAETLNVSRATLNRKIKALTDLSPAALLKLLRLKKARQLLQQEFGNISEVAFEVGFNSPSHFTRSFVQQFGQSPTEEIKSKTP
jgi:signal transduction histidine kinase/ligand-binding sensor domain-containing protein/DNA-binding response OmpR family regulator